MCHRGRRLPGAHYPDSEHGPPTPIRTARSRTGIRIGGTEGWGRHHPLVHSRTDHKPRRGRATRRTPLSAANGTTVVMADDPTIPSIPAVCAAAARAADAKSGEDTVILAMG